MRSSREGISSIGTPATSSPKAGLTSWLFWELIQHSCMTGWKLGKAICSISTKSRLREEKKLPRSQTSRKPRRRDHAGLAWRSPRLLRRGNNSWAHEWFFRWDREQCREDRGLDCAVEEGQFWEGSVETPLSDYQSTTPAAKSWVSQERESDVRSCSSRPCPSRRT